MLQSVLFWFFICLRNDFRVIDFCPEIKTLISILFVMMVVGCGKTEAEKREEEGSKESVKELTKEDCFRSYQFGNEKLDFRRLWVLFLHFPTQPVNNIYLRRFI